MEGGFKNVLSSKEQTIKEVMMMNGGEILLIIIPTGFYNTGSSAITHICMEVEGVNNAEGLYEARILYDPDCIRDLEYHLVENPHRQNTSYAIKRFKQYIDFNSNPIFNHHYEKMCKGHFKEISYDYIRELCDVVFYGNSYQDAYSRGKSFWIFNRIYGKIYRDYLLNRVDWGRESLLPKRNVQYGGTYDYEMFITATKKYVGSIIDYINNDYADNIILDQFVPTTGIDSYLKYFPERYPVRVIIVDRDPRDLFVLAKYYKHTKSIPVDSVKTFCQWFKWTRGQSERQGESDFVMRVRFEDLVYEYNKTRDLLMEFCGFDKVRNPPRYTYFNPQESINNTQVWNRYPLSEKEIYYIETHLSKYCYNYREKKLSPDYKYGKIFEC